MCRIQPRRRIKQQPSLDGMFDDVEVKENTLPTIEAKSPSEQQRDSPNLPSPLRLDQVLTTVISLELVERGSLRSIARKMRSNRRNVLLALETEEQEDQRLSRVVALPSTIAPQPVPTKKPQRNKSTAKCLPVLDEFNLTKYNDGRALAA